MLHVQNRLLSDAKYGLSTKEETQGAPVDIVWWICCGISVYAKKESPRTSYELFVDTYVECHEHESVCRADVRNAQAKWNEIKSDSGAVDQFTLNVEDWRLEQAVFNFYLQQFIMN